MHQSVVGSRGPAGAAMDPDARSAPMARGPQQPFSSGEADRGVSDDSSDHL